MAVTYFPFQAGAGAPVLDTQWQQMMSLMFRDGVWANTLNKLNTTAGAGLQVLVDTGDSMTNGLFMNNSASFAINLAAADPTNPRKDNIVIHADLVARTVTLIALTGTPNVSPVVPAVTQSATVWEISIQNLTVVANGTVPSSLVDTRTYTPNWPVVYQQSGVAENGFCGGQGKVVTAGDTLGTGVNFKRQMQVTPSSCTLVRIGGGNDSTQTAVTMHIYGFLFTYNGVAAGAVSSTATYATVGNSIRAVRAGAFDFHCDADLIDPKTKRIIGKCDSLLAGRSLRGDLEAFYPTADRSPGALALRHVCPNCGAAECFNTALSSEDEALLVPDWPQRMRDAAYIRQMQEQLKLPMVA